MSAVSRAVEVAKVSSPAVAVSSQGTTGRSQRATRHKKINFLEMLRGDSVGSVDDDNTEAGDKNHKQKIKTELYAAKKKRKIMEEKKRKVVQYTIETETDSSEETDSVESDYASSYDTDTTSDSDVAFMRKQPLASQRKFSPFVAPKLSGKSKVKVLPSAKPYGRQLKVKIGTNRSRSLTTSTPVALKPPGKSKSCKISSPDTSPVCGDRKLTTGVVLQGNVPVVFGKKISEKYNSSKTMSSSVNHNADHHLSSSLVTDNLFPSKSMDVLKVSPTLPDEILEAPKCSQNETKPEHSDSVLGNHEINGNDKLLVNSDNVIKNRERYLANGSGLHTVSPMSVLKGKEVVRVAGDDTPLRIIHRDASPLTEPRNRSQLGEVFVDRYQNKKSACVRCYTCRKLMTVDSFLRHLHDVVSGGLIAVNSARTVDISDTELTDKECKIWETFQRKKELFDNNQIPSPELMAESLVYSLDGEGRKHLLSEAVLPGEIEKKASGPRIIKTPISQTKKGKIVRKSDPKLPVNMARNTGSTNKTVPKTTPVDSIEGVRSSSRKRKVKQLYPFEEYSFTKFPRLMKNAEKNLE